MRPGPLAPNYLEAQIWLRRAADGGHSGAARILGQMLLRSPGIARNLDEAVAWLRKAAARGDDCAKAELAQLALARQVPANDQRATAAWFEQRAGAGDSTAAFNLGICLAEGIGIQRNDAIALRMFRHLAEHLPLAQYWCGRMLSEGRGSPPDLAAARNWFLRAADQHVADAEVAAGEMLINGRGGPRDPILAVSLFIRAAASGHPGASIALKILRQSEDNEALTGDKATA
jgi:TPR repeat protein